MRWIHLVLLPSCLTISTTTHCHDKHENELHITEIQVKIVDQAGAGVDPLSGSTLEVEIRTGNEGICATPFLNGLTGFIPGEVVVFYGEQIGTCGQISIDPHCFKLALIHGGNDNMQVEWVRLVLDNGHYLTCPDGMFIFQARRELKCLHSRLHFTSSDIFPILGEENESTSSSSHSTTCSDITWLIILIGMSWIIG